jgi:hypothetical protein
MRGASGSLGGRCPRASGAEATSARTGSLCTRIEAGVGGDRAGCGQVDCEGNRESFNHLQVSRCRALRVPLWFQRGSHSFPVRIRSRAWSGGRTTEKDLRDGDTGGPNGGRDSGSRSHRSPESQRGVFKWDPNASDLRPFASITTAIWTCKGMAWSAAACCHPQTASKSCPPRNRAARSESTTTCQAENMR